MKYLLLRKKKGETEWKSTTKGEMKYILTVLELNLDAPSLKEYSYKIEPII